MQADEDKTPPKKAKPPSISDLVRGKTPPPATTPKPPPATAKAPTAPNPGSPGMVMPPSTPPPVTDWGRGGDGGGGGGGSAPPYLPVTGAPGYDPLATLRQNWQMRQNAMRAAENLRQNWQVGQNVQRTAQDPALSTLRQNWQVGQNVGRIFNPSRPNMSVPAPRVYLGEQPMTGDGNQPARQFTWNAPAAAPPVISAAERARGIPSTYSGPPVAGTFQPAPAGVPLTGDIPRMAAQGAAAGGIGAIANNPIFAQGGGGGGAAPGGGASAPYGVDPVWYNQFQQEHGGLTPEEVYQYSDNPLGQALWDKAWGDQFLAGNYRPPTEQDWRNTYGQRNYLYNSGANIYGQGGYGGGGYGGGGGGYGVENPALSALPQNYNAGFTLAFGTTPEAYYTPERGGAKQMQADYYSLHDMWQAALGRAVDPGEWANIWRGLLSYKASRPNQAAPLTMADLYGYVNQMTRRGPQPNELSYLNIAEQ